MRSFFGMVFVCLLTGCALDSGKNLSPEQGTPVKPVLIIIAQKAFYYQEYEDPRVALEEAGLTVKVASLVTTEEATPHSGSWEKAGQPPNVTPDLTLENVVAADYSALVISGGWGATNYFYAFEGDPDDNTYDRNVVASTRVNELINAFLEADKPILGVCNGVNVLSWARLTGTDDSPIKGKTVAAPHQSVPSMNYKASPHAYPDTDLMMTDFATDNGATVTKEDEIGDKSSPRDDVYVDGLILTAQNNLAAYKGGQVLAGVLK